MKNKEKFFNKATIIYSVLCVFIISVAGFVFLFMEHIDKSTVIKSGNSAQIEDAIDKIHQSADNSKKEYSAEIFGLININTARKEDLMLLPGIGNLKADAIIEYRKSTPFKSIKDVLKVDGISEKTFEKIKNSICID